MIEYIKLIMIICFVILAVKSFNKAKEIEIQIKVKPPLWIEILIKKIK